MKNTIIFRFRYKDEYEKFKLVLSIIGFFLSLMNLLTKKRALELTFLFLLVWYYCTLTIRESILKVNGSKIKGWWRVHHFISTVASAVLLVWPNSETWFIFRPQFMIFNVLISKYNFFLLNSSHKILNNIFTNIYRCSSIIPICISTRSTL